MSLWTRQTSSSARSSDRVARSVAVARTLPPEMAGVVAAVIPLTGVDVSDVAIHLKRHGVRRVWFTRCDSAHCPLNPTVDADFQEGGAEGAGHLYTRKRDLAHCVEGNAVVPVDRTRHWVTGRAYDGVPFPRSVPPGTRYVVTVKVPQILLADQFPAERTYHRAKTAGPTTVATPMDDVVFVLAHELAHIEQFRTGAPRSEVAAERVGREVLHRWVAAGRPGA